jgi:hypothetical protein
MGYGCVDSLAAKLSADGRPRYAGAQRELQQVRLEVVNAGGSDHLQIAATGVLIP